MTAIDAIPIGAGATNPLLMGPLESLALTFDFSPNLGLETIVTVAATLADTHTGATYPNGLAAAPTVLGSVVTQRIAGLAAGGAYLLVVAVTTSGGNSWEMHLRLQC